MGVGARGLDYREILQVGNQVAADFGIARCKSSTYLVTTEGTGTPAYMAPELFGQEKACEKVDVYSLGMVLWQCLTGKTPWGHLTVPFQVVMLVGIEQKRGPACRLPAPPPEPHREVLGWRSTAPAKLCRDRETHPSASGARKVVTYPTLHISTPPND